MAAIFESHAHYEDRKFDPDRAGLLSALPKLNISPVINVGSTVETTKQSVGLAQDYSYIYAAIGLHPSELAGVHDGFVDYLREHAGDRKVVAIGEIGLDYHYLKEDARHRLALEAGYKSDEEAEADGFAPDEAALKEAMEVQKDLQKTWFLRQLELAREVGLPCIFHLRDAAADSMAILKEAAAKGTRGVLHCYSYSAEQAAEYAKMGYYFGVGGSVTFKNAKKLQAVVAGLPLSRILTETDCPYMAPEPFRGRRNESTYLPYVVKKIADLKEISEDEVISRTAENGYRLFSKIRGGR